MAPLVIEHDGPERRKWSLHCSSLGPAVLHIEEVIALRMLEARSVWRGEAETNYH